MMNPEQQNNFQLPEEEGIDIKKYIFLILSHWWWFAIALFVSLTIAYLVNRYSQEVYMGYSSVIIGEPDARTGSVESILDELSRAKGKSRKAIVENEISILKSYKMARMALEELDFGITYTAIGRRNIAESQLYRACPFVVQIDTLIKMEHGKNYQLNILSQDRFLLIFGEEDKGEYYFGEKIVKNGLACRIILRSESDYVFEPQQSNKYFFTINSINAQAKNYSNALSVEVNAEKGSILTLSIAGFVPQQIADYLNKLSEVYIRTNLEEKNMASENTIKFIDEQLHGIVDSLEVTGLRLQKFRSANKVINLSKEGTFLFDKMQELQSEKTVFDINERYYKYLQDYINKKTDFSDVVAPSIIGIADPLLTSLVATLNTLNLQRRNLGMSVMENSPQFVLVNNQIENTRAALRENLISLIAANEIAIKDLDVRIVKIEKEVQKLPGTERQMISIEREFTINDQIYTFLLEKRAEAGITRASNTSDHKLLDIARPENASLIKPKALTNYIMAFAAGGALPLALLLLLEFFNTKITDRKYLETNLKAPIIGSIGHNEGGSDLPVSENPRSSLAESFRALRTNLQYILQTPDAKVFAISSAVSGEGKTFCSVNMASILAMNDKKTLIVSLDLRRPKVHKVFNLPNEKGMSTFLIGRDTFEGIISETNINNLYVATSGPIPPNPSELLGSAKMLEFIQEARAKYDYVLLDTPPVAIVTDTLTLKDLIDAFVFVIRHNYSDKQVIDLVNSIYNKHLISNTGVIINDIQVKGYYGYSYRYGYGYGYSYSYRNAYYEDEKPLKRIRNIFNRK
jgi:capsular exopolysaccharide synthesis family protein